MGYCGINTGDTHGGTISSAKGRLQFDQAGVMRSCRDGVIAGASQKRSLAHPVPAHIVGSEIAWRQPPATSTMTPPRILVSRWGSSDGGARDAHAETASTGYVVDLALRQMDIRLSVSGRVVQDGIAAPGMMHVSEPSAPAHCQFRGPYDALHLHVPHDLLREHAADNSALLRSAPAMERDPVALQLGLSLLNAEEFGPAFGRIYADGVSLAIVTRLLALQAHGRPSPRRTEGLSKWRLQRATDYIDAHLDEPVSLADVATACGLSRMHFAAQFKAATGCRPHDYVLRRRISRAQELIMGSATPLVEVSLQVGFQSQSHFTTVFGRLVGQTPHAWRKSRRSSSLR